MKDTVWFIGVVLALGVTWGMTSQRISAMEKDIDRMEEAIVMFTKMEVRLAVIEAEIKNINKKLDN
jgi:hypothetical protein|tara:strand:+ start:602 stop:799 length:198 start_codon:yes stop_codon:yes gene_type:complete